MFCPSCGKELPHQADQGTFCMFCGARLEVSEQATPTVNTLPPENIGGVWFLFDGPVRLVQKQTFFSWAKVARDGFILAFQLVDKKRIPTAYDGAAILSIKVKQSFMGSTALYDTLLKTKLSLNIDRTQFVLDKEGNPLYILDHKQEVRLRIDDYVYRTVAEIEIWFTPKGSREKIYKRVEISANPQM